MRKRLLLIVPHTKKAQGAQAVKLESGVSLSEYELGYAVLPKVQAITNQMGIATLVADRNNGWKAIQEKVIKEYNASPVDTDVVDLSLELHFNSFDNPKAHGLEILVQKKDTQTAQFARDLAKYVGNAYGLTLRHDDGVKLLSDSERGDYNLSSIERISRHEILTEFFFGSCLEDCKKIFSRGLDFYAKTIAIGVAASFFNVYEEEEELDKTWLDRYNGLRADLMDALERN